MKYYTGIGSRETPLNILNMMTNIAMLLVKHGFILRSGGADGADSAFENGATNSEIYLPWKGFNGNISPLYNISESAMKMAREYHPSWNSLSTAAKKLMARNCMQILGSDLNTPSQFVICWTKDGCENKATRKSSTGGTGQAIAIASDYGIPVYNLRNETSITKLSLLISDTKERK